MREAEKIAIMGDWHGNTWYAQHAIRRAAGQGAQAIVHTGDFGFWFEESFISDVTDVLQEYDLHLYFVDGNHDDHDYLAQLPKEPDGTGRVSPRIFHLPRGFRWRWAGCTFLALGGAVSVDQYHRTPPGPHHRGTWWPQEALTHDDIASALTGPPVDILITHDSPSGTRMSLNPDGWPPELIKASEANQKAIRTVVETVEPTYLWHGHHHQHYMDLLPLPSGKTCQVVGLDCDHAMVHENMDVVDLTRLASYAIPTKPKEKN